MSELFLDLFRSLAEPLWALGRPAERVFLPYLLTALLMAVGLALAGPRPRATLARDLLARRIWAAPSARLDYQLLFVKAVLRAALFGSRTVSALAVAAIVAHGLRRVTGVTSGPALPEALVAALLALASFVALDLARFAVHRALHRVPVLWEFHKLHHSAEVLTPFTLYRTHPVESLLNAAATAGTVGTVLGIFVWLFGGRVHGWEVFGVDAIGLLWTLAGANLRHSHVWLSYGPRVERLVLSPAQHQVHHSVLAAHRDRNFGTALALWDRWGGSLYTTSGRREPLRFGLPEGEPGAGADVGVLASLVLPLVAAARVTARAARSIGRGLAGASGRARVLGPARTAVVLLACVALQPGCARKKFDRAALLGAIGQCTVATYRDFEGAAAGLRAATEAAVTDGNRRAAAQDAWRQAIGVWQQAELTQFGPLGVAPAPGAMAMREGIYSWPNVDRCEIDKQTVSKDYEGGLLVTVAPSTRGLGALEYLLFYDGADNGCGETSSINAGGTWAALAPAERSARKAAYAAAAAADVEKRAHALVMAWEAGAGDFLAQLTTAGTGSTLFPTQSAAFDAVSAGLYYVDTTLKDEKLAVPLGLLDCATGRCPERSESRWAGVDRAHLAANLAGFGRLFKGCGADESALGFEDLLDAAGASTVGASMHADLDRAVDAVAAIPDPALPKALAADADKVQQAHAAVKRITDALKGEFVLVLQIHPPGVVLGDTD